MIAHGVPAAAIQNSAGKFEYPNLTNIENAAQFIKRIPANNALAIVNPPVQSSLVKQWVGYTLGAGRVFGPALDFPALPSVVRKASKASEATLKTLR